MRHTIKSAYGDHTMLIADDSTLEEMQEANPVFFDNPSSDDENLEVYQGFLIVTNTDVHASGGPVKRYSVFMFVIEGIPKAYLTCVSSCKNSCDSPSDCYELVNRIIDEKRYRFE